MSSEQHACVAALLGVLKQHFLLPRNLLMDPESICAAGAWAGWEMPPAARIRCCSSLRSGRWSWVRRSALPPRQSTARESPVLAQTMCEREMSVMTEVLPLWSWPD